MASTKTFIIIAMAAVFLPSILGKEFIVGDSTGWTTNFDYQAWAQDKHFQVGDKLVFNYKKGAHNVFRVNGTAFQQCSIPPANEALTTGNDVISLATPGNKWYICGVAKHCALGNVHEARHNCATSTGIFVTFACTFTGSCTLSPGFLQPQIQALPLDITDGCFDSHDLVLD